MPVAVRVSADGYENAEAQLTEMSGATVTLTLKKKAVAPKQNPVIIKTTR